MVVGRGELRVRRHSALGVLLTGDWVVPVSAPPIADGAVLIRGEKIAEVGSAAELRARHAGEEVREFPGCALIPGLVNAHTHLDYSAFYGFPRARGFMRWIIRLTRARMRLDADDLAASALWGAYECLRHGVTSIADTSYGGDTVARAALAVGIRARVYLEVFGLDDERIAATIERLGTALTAAQFESGLDRPGGIGRSSARWTPKGSDAAVTRLGHVEWGISPHAPYTVSQALYSEVTRFARASGLSMATHLAESKTEVRLLARGAAPVALFYRIVSKSAGGRWRLPKVRPVQYVAESGALGVDMLAVHAVQLDSEDIRDLAVSGTSVAHCPRSNLKLRCGAAPVAEMRTAGIKVGLGTDSLASNDNLDMLAEMRAALAVSASRELERGDPALHAAEVLRMATLDGAAALGWEDSLGSLEAGKIADITVIRLPGIDDRGSSEDEVAANIMAGEVRLTIVGGEVAYDEEGSTAPPADLAEVRVKLGLKV